MAKFQDGVLGTTTGRIGNIVIQGSCNGKIVREHVEPSNPRTERQVAQRERFATAGKLAKGFIPLAVRGLKLCPNGSKRYCAVVKGIMDGLLARDSYPAIQPAAVPYSEGELPMPELQALGGKIGWTVDPARADDVALIALVDRDGELTISHSSTMSAGEHDLPAGFHGVAMLAFASKDDASPVAHVSI